MDKKAEIFYKINEPYAAGLFEEPESSKFERYSRATRRYFENCSLTEYKGGSLYPSGSNFNDDYTVMPNYSYAVRANAAALKKKDAAAFELMNEELKPGSDLLVAGYMFETVKYERQNSGFIHSIPNYGRIAKEGLNSYEDRTNALPPGSFRNGMLDVIAGIRDYHSRSLKYLEQINADEKLINALKVVPFYPAETLYEALVCWNFIFYIDMCDNPGRLDADLIDFYKGEDITDNLRDFFKNVDDNWGWSGALGPNYNPLTIQCLKAVAGLRRPSFELRVTEDMPDEIWDAAIECLLSGSGQPAFYNEPLYQKTLHEKFPYIPKEDLLRFCGGGCTETMLAGISNVGSTDTMINAAQIFETSMHCHLSNANDFDAFFNACMTDIKENINHALGVVSEFQKFRAEFHPHPVRSLLTDDCIDKGLDFNAGGARYYWSVNLVHGLINVIDSMLAVRELIYRKKEYTPNEFLELLKNEDEALYSRLGKCPVYGVDDPDADNLAAVTADIIWTAFNQQTPYLGGAFLAASIAFNDYVGMGKPVGPTPDGRRRGDPLCDSISPIHCNDTKGPTAMLSSAAKLHHHKALGTVVTNIKLNREHLSKTLRPLVVGYFNQGGMQLQVNCVSKEDMLDAQINPHLHKNLIVRVGGYAEYFNYLTPVLQQDVISRIEH